MADSALLDRLLLKEEVTEFLLYEADLLDEHRYDEWLDLLTEDLSYTMPLRLNVGSCGSRPSKMPLDRRSGLVVGPAAGLGVLPITRFSTASIR